MEVFHAQVIYNPNLMLLTSLHKGSNVATKVGLLLVHRNSFGQKPFLLPPMTDMGTSGSCVQTHWP